MSFLIRADTLPYSTSDASWPDQLVLHPPRWRHATRAHSPGPWSDIYICLRGEIDPGSLACLTDETMTSRQEKERTR
jgi:hypothetical protein